MRVIRHGHWGCGWIEYITVDDTAPDTLLDQCVEIARALDCYPVYDDDRYSEAQWKVIADYWEWLDLRERVDLCRDNGVSIFAARRSSVPDQVYQDLSNSTFV